MSMSVYLCATDAHVPHICMCDSGTTRKHRVQQEGKDAHHERSVRQTLQTLSQAWCLR